MKKVTVLPRQADICNIPCFGHDKVGKSKQLWPKKSKTFLNIKNSVSIGVSLAAIF